MEELIPLIRDGVLGGAALVLALRLDAVLRGLQSRLDRLDAAVRALPCQHGGDCPVSGRKASKAAALLGLLLAGWAWSGCAGAVRVEDPAVLCAAQCGAAARACLDSCRQGPTPEGSGQAQSAPLWGARLEGGE